ncbi:uncharacterized protein BKA78DRAFT_110097 [Phyllosticta capitalensis]|uniref:Uncharacterized protein n=1 Tax=Phyllosticta capitalensis TaxID=121624 RepID=A0ABR1YV55_9PEZI
MCDRLGGRRAPLPPALTRTLECSLPAAALSCIPCPFCPALPASFACPARLTAAGLARASTSPVCLRCRLQFSMRDLQCWSLVKDEFSEKMTQRSARIPDQTTPCAARPSLSSNPSTLSTPLPRVVTPPPCPSACLPGARPTPLPFLTRPVQSAARRAPLHSYTSLQHTQHSPVQRRRARQSIQAQRPPMDTLSPPCLNEQQPSNPFLLLRLLRSLPVLMDSSDVQTLCVLPGSCARTSRHTTHSTANRHVEHIQPPAAN